MIALVNKNLLELRLPSCATVCGSDLPEVASAERQRALDRMYADSEDAADATYQLHHGDAQRPSATATRAASSVNPGVGMVIEDDDDVHAERHGDSEASGLCWWRMLWRVSRQRVVVHKTCFSHVMAIKIIWPHLLLHVCIMNHEWHGHGEGERFVTWVDCSLHLMCDLSAEIVLLVSITSLSRCS
jgi:hypothetical protein